MKDESFNRRKWWKRTRDRMVCAKSPKVDKIFCAPGNAGIAEFARMCEYSGQWNSINWLHLQKKMQSTLQSLEWMIH